MIDYFTHYLERRNGLIKNQPEFWKPLLTKYPLSKYELTLIDDNAMNIECAGRLGMRTIHINSDCDLHSALLKHLGIIDPHFVFNEVDYLLMKNQLDRSSKNQGIESKLAEMLQQRISSSNQKTLTMVDLGAGN